MEKMARYFIGFFSNIKPEGYINFFTKKSDQYWLIYGQLALQDEGVRARLLVGKDCDFMESELFIVQ